MRTECKHFDLMNLICTAVSDTNCRGKSCGKHPSYQTCQKICTIYEPADGEMSRPVQKSLPSKAVSVSKAIATGRYVSDEILRERQATCESCVHFENGTCGICTCNVTKGIKIRNLAAYEERLPEWGCKHPQRSQGQGWKR